MNDRGARAGILEAGASLFGALPVRRWSALCALVVAASTGALPAAAQTFCPSAGFTNSRAEPPLLDAFSVLFRQNGVSFHARVETDQTAPGGRLVIRNGNSYDVELSYDVVVTGSAAPVSAEGRCARIRAGEYAVDADANTVIRYDGGTPAAVRVRNLRMARVASAGEAIKAAAAPPPATPTTTAAAPASSAELNQYRCGDGGAPGQRACSTAFMAAAARAAADAGRFTGTTRECLLEYAAVQESAAGLIRASDARGDSLRLTTPACYNRGEARWGYEALAAACPHGAWTAANGGRVDCAAAAHLATTDSLRRDSAAMPPNAAEVAANGFAAGLLLLQQGLATEAEGEFRQALTFTPADPSLHAALGTALAQQQRWTEAEAAYRAAVWLDPSNTEFSAMLRGLRARGAPTAQTVVHARTGPARALSVTEKPAVTRRVNIPALVAATFKIVFATALTAAGLLLFFPVLSALYLALLWGGGRILRLGT